MKVKELINDLSLINPDYDVMVKVGKDERDLITKIHKIFCVNSVRNPAIGFVELETCNRIDWWKNEQPRKVEEMKANNELAKLLDDTQKDILNSDMGESYLRIDGKEYYTDMGYALEGIEIFIEILKERIENEQKQNS